MGGSHLPPTRSCALEDWKGFVGDDGDVAGGTLQGFLLVPRSAAGVGAEEEGVEVAEEEGVVEEAVEQAVGTMEATMTEAEEDGQRKVGKGVGED